MENTEVIQNLENLKLQIPGLQVEFDRSPLHKNLYKFYFYDPKNKIKGFGASFSILSAFMKGRSEFLERNALNNLYALDKSIKTSSGFAAHTCPESACQNARLEMIERDAFLISWLIKKPPVWLPNNFIKAFLPMDFENTFLEHGVELKIGIISKCRDAFTLVSCLVFERQGELARIAIDTAAGFEIGAVLNSVYKGAIIRLESYLFADRLGHREIDPVAHFFYHSDTLRDVGWFLEDGISINEYDFPSHDTHIVQSDILGTGVYVAQCKGDFQQYFTGETDEIHLNFSRLKRFSDDLTQINRIKHPLP